MIESMKYAAKSPEGMARVARAVFSHVRRAPLDCAYVVGLSGELGAGKTTFTKILARELGIKRNVSSPTFILERTYRIPSSGRYARRFSRLVHIDAYRLTRHDTIFANHLRALRSDPRNLILIEWPERIGRMLPKNILRISFAHKDEKTRIVTIGARSHRE